MGSVFRKTTTRPIPASAKIERKGGKTIARWKLRSGKWVTAEIRVAKDGREVIRQSSGTYFARYRDHDGEVHDVPTGCRDKSMAEQFLADLEKQADRVRAGVVTEHELAVADLMAGEIERHIVDYAATLTGSADHRKKTEKYIRQVATACKWNSLAAMRRDDLELWLAEQTRRGRSARSRNAFHTAVVSFTNWCVKVKRLTMNPFARLAKADVALDRRHIRRSLSVEEIERIARAAENASQRPPVKPGEGDVPKGHRPAERLTAGGRAFLWRFLVRTGLRLNEARGLTVGDLRLDGKLRGMDLPATLTKAKEAQYQPLLPDLAEGLRRLVKGRKPTDLVFAIPADIIRRFKADCKRAGIPLKDERGRVVDIHALRLSFIDALVKAGVHPRIVQMLARHSDISITMKHYTDIRVHDLHAAMASAFPTLGGGDAIHAGDDLHAAMAGVFPPVAPPAGPSVAPFVAPSVAPTPVNLVQRRSSPVKLPASGDSPQVLKTKGKRRVS
jgi:integrase